MTIRRSALPTTTRPAARRVLKDTWLTAEKADASQRVEAPNASVLTQAVKVLDEAGGRRGRQ
jgi:hypothetical protein